MFGIRRRLANLSHLMRPLALAFVGCAILALGIGYVLTYLYRTLELPWVFYYLTIQFVPQFWRGVLFLLLGVGTLSYGIWSLSDKVVIPINTQAQNAEVLLDYRRTDRAPRLAVLSGGPGMLVLASLGRTVDMMTCITPVQDPVEYYYRASSLFNFEKVVFVVPTPQPIDVVFVLDNGVRVKPSDRVTHDERYAERYVVDVHLDSTTPLQQLQVTRATLDAIAQADAIILGPGSLFESIIPNLLMPAVREALQASKAKKIYICSIMTEPGLTHGFTVADHIRQIVRYGGIVPDYVLVNAQRIDADVQRIYAAARQTPVYLAPEEYEETVVQAIDRGAGSGVVVEGALVIEADVATAVIQLTASLEDPGKSRTVRVLRHDPDKVAAAITSIMQRGR
ncbi:MAG: 2-phospho-L-lactate transferase CofD family protein [Roseiflexaceae bacterium]